MPIATDAFKYNNVRMFQDTFVYDSNSMPHPGRTSEAYIRLSGGLIAELTSGTMTADRSSFRTGIHTKLLSQTNKFGRLESPPHVEADILKTLT